MNTRSVGCYLQLHAFAFCAMFLNESQIRDRHADTYKFGQILLKQLAMSFYEKLSFGKQLLKHKET